MLAHNHLSADQPFQDWLDQVLEELGELGIQKNLNEEERDWFFDIWDNYPMSPAEAAQSYINETT